VSKKYSGNYFGFGFSFVLTSVEIGRVLLLANNWFDFGFWIQLKTAQTTICYKVMSCLPSGGYEKAFKQFMIRSSLQTSAHRIFAMQAEL